MIILYDNNCVVCRSFKNWIIRRDKKNVLSFISNDFESVKNKKIKVNLEFPINTIIFIDQNKVYKGSRAIFLTLSKTGGFLGIISQILATPVISYLLQGPYVIFAKNRGKFARFFNG
ncbi:MAG: hypothetical protein CL746_05765 [Chloroflexi bacterium]|nr:hypothetical protein [Chloroflexota bacterium]|tara:strand:- start:702 stop:1052 length:351 start_codon:yes stop_codon:yes gene_type:complete